MTTMTKVAVAAGITLLFTGCCSSSMEVLPNGYSYYGNSCSCANSKMMADGSTLRCYDQNGNYTGNLYPLRSNQVANIRYQEAKQQADDRARRAKRDAQTASYANTALSVSNNMNTSNSSKTFKTYDAYGNLVNSNSNHTTKDAYGNYVKSNKSHKTYDAYGTLVNSGDCYTTKDAYGRFVKTCK